MYEFFFCKGMSSMSKKLSFEQIVQICKRENVQSRIEAFVKRNERQGINQKFISKENMYFLILKMKYNPVFDNKLGSIGLVEENYFGELVLYTTACIATDAFNADASSENAVLKLVDEELSIANRERIFDFFLRMFSCAMEWKERFEYLFNEFYSEKCEELGIVPGDVAYRCFQELREEYLEMLEKVFPMGRHFEVENLYNNVVISTQEREKIDFTKAFEIIPFEAYYNRIFKTIDDTTRQNPDSQISEDFMRFKSKEEIKRICDEYFESYVLNEVLVCMDGIQEGNAEEISKAINQMVVDNPVLLGIRYIQALLLAYQNEIARVMRQLTDYLDKNNVTYVQNGKIHNQQIMDVRGFMGWTLPS